MAIIILGIIVLTSALFIAFPKERNLSIISPLAETGKFLLSLRGKSIENVVKKSLAGTHGTYAIVIKNLKTGETYKQHGERAFDSASLYKLWVLGASFKLIKEGKLTENTDLTRDVRQLNEIFKIGTDSAELTEGTVNMKVGDAIEQMITISHNYAALLLVSEIRNSRVASFMREQGFKSSRLGEPPKTNASDIALFFEKLYFGTMVDSSYSKRMLEILARQKLNDRIPKYLPPQIEVAHKTGEIDGFKHDAGIVFGREPIIIVVLSESDSPQGAAQRIAELSKNVFDYFERD